MTRVPAAAAVLSLDEQELLSRLRGGEEGAFEALIRRYGGRMIAVARRLVRNEEDAQDVLQEAFLGAFRNLEQFGGQAQLGTWLHRIVVNAALMKLRGKSRRPETSIEELMPTFDSQGHAQQPTRRWRDDLGSALERQETRDLVQRTIARLPEAFRTVLVLRDIEELDTRETAEALSVTENAVKTRLHRARIALKTMLDEHFAGDGA